MTQTPMSQDAVRDVFQSLSENPSRPQTSTGWNGNIEQARSDFFGTFNPMFIESNTDTSKTWSKTPGHEDGQPIITKTNQGVSIFRATFDLHNYAPESAHVKTDDTKCVVTAKEQTREGHSLITKEYTKEMCLPEGVDPYSITCSISATGVLTIEGQIAPTCTRDISTSIKPHSAPHLFSGIDPDGKSFPRVENVRVFEKNTVGLTKNVPHPLPMAKHSSLQTYRSSGEVPYEGRALSNSPHCSKLTEVKPIEMDSKGKLYTIDVDVEDHKPDEIQVKTVDQKLYVSASRENRVGDNTTTKQLMKEYTLPGNVKASELKAFFTDSGKLLVEAPFI